MLTSGFKAGAPALVTNLQRTAAAPTTALWSSSGGPDPGSRLAMGMCDPGPARWGQCHTHPTRHASANGACVAPAPQDGASATRTPPRVPPEMG